MNAINSDIVSMLRDDARLLWRDLGAAVGVSANAAADRVRRLRRAGVITDVAALIDPAAGGRTLPALVGVHLAPRSRLRRVRHRSRPLRAGDRGATPDRPAGPQSCRARNSPSRARGAQSRDQGPAGDGRDRGCRGPSTFKSLGPSGALTLATTALPCLWRFDGDLILQSKDTSATAAFLGRMEYSTAAAPATNAQCPARDRANASIRRLRLRYLQLWTASTVKYSGCSERMLGFRGATSVPPSG